MQQQFFFWGGKKLRHYKYWLALESYTTLQLKYYLHSRSLPKAADPLGRPMIDNTDQPGLGSLQKATRPLESYA